MAQVTLGGERLGAGNKNKIHLKNYERSSHDLSYIWRSTMASGTLVPFMTEVALPGDTFDINLNCDILTHPTIGPLFGQYKIQLDVFQIPIRLYQGKLHMNMLGIGMDMSQIKLPQIQLFASDLDVTQVIDNQQINPSCIFSYLGIRGLGYRSTPNPAEAMQRRFNAIPYLGYWDIYKQYYSNKQEEIGVVIHRSLTSANVLITDADIRYASVPVDIPHALPIAYTATQLNKKSELIITGTGITPEFDTNRIRLTVKWGVTQAQVVIPATDMFKEWDIYATNGVIIGRVPTDTFLKNIGLSIGFIEIAPKDLTVTNQNTEPQLFTFPLKNIDDMRQNILADVKNVNSFNIRFDSPHPYSLSLGSATDTVTSKQIFSCASNQEGLGIKTYQSDLFNNWISTEWIDGVDGISAITSIDTSDGSFTIDELNLSKKIYDMLNRIALSGGTYDDWLDAVYVHDRQRAIESPMYLGGLIKNLVFQEVVSNSDTEQAPLGTLAGRGKIGGKHKGGKIIAKVDEPSYLMGIISLTPIIDYSQGNKWDVNLKTMNDFHKPALDEIGFQDLITDQMAWWDTEVTDTTGAEIFKSAGKQPAWINYMTNVNVVRGNFADQTQQMFMTLNRRYETSFTGTNATIKDLTTYVDPSKFNHIFANTRRDAQNFWAQISVDIHARRKMSARVIPNL